MPSRSKVILLGLFLLVATDVSVAQEDRDIYKPENRQHAQEVENAAYEYMVRDFYNQPWSEPESPTVLAWRSMPVWALVTLLLGLRMLRSRRL